MQLSHRLFSALVALSTLSLPVFAGRSLRQHVEPRALVDSCATITARDLISVRLSLPKFAYDGCLDICLCLSTLPVAIHANADLHQLVLTYGEDLVKKDLTLLINYSRTKQTCQYPDNSKPVCNMGNPCDFDCVSPYVRRSQLCACEFPYRLCNGVCGTFRHGCGSAAPYQRRINEKLRARSRGIFTHEDALSTCAHDEQVCGVSQGSAAFECLNTDTALESCGGCVSPNPFLLMSEQGPEGVDCTALPYVQNVRCSAGRCVVQACSNGYVPSSDHIACIRENRDTAAIVVQPAHI